jgi:hypothetical protein
MKSQRSVGPVKSPLRIPASTLTTERLSALEAFERWQRESPRSLIVSPTEDSSMTDGDQPAKN